MTRVPVDGRPIRVVLLDDYEVVEAGLAALLKPFGDGFCVASVACSEPLPADADVVLYDPATAPTGERLDVQAVLGASPARLVLFTWDTPPGVHTVPETAAFGFLSKAATGPEIAAALKAFVHGTRWPRGKAQPSSPVPPPTHRSRAATTEDLSSRETQILSLIAQGFSNAAIAHHTGLSINSVKMYVRFAYAKIGVTSRTQAVRWSLEHDLIPNHAPRRQGAPTAKHLADAR